MKNIQKVFLLGVMIVTSLQAGQQAGLPLGSNQTQQQENKTALNMIQAMQDCVSLNKKVEQYINSSMDEMGLKRVLHDIKDSFFYITSFFDKDSPLRTKYGITDAENKLTQKLIRPISVDVNIHNELIMQTNEHRALFSHLLNEYILQFGRIVAKQGGLFEGYRTSYYLASKDDESLSITPNEHALLVETLENAIKQANWKETIELSLLVTHKNNDIVKKTFTLNEIVAAIKQVPLPLGYYSPAMIATGVGTAAAVGVGAYYAYNAYTQGLNSLEEKVDNISDTLENNVKPTSQPTLLPKDQFDVHQFSPERQQQQIQQLEQENALEKKAEDLKNLINMQKLPKINILSDNSTPVEPSRLAGQFEIYKQNAEVNALNADLATYAAAGADSELTPLSLQNTETPEEVTKVIQDYVIPTANVAAIAIPSAQAVRGVQAIRTVGVAAATGVEKGIAEFGVTKLNVPTFPTATVKPAVITPITPPPISTIGQQFEYFPRGYVKPSTPPSTPISPNWETYFGR